MWAFKISCILFFTLLLFCLCCRREAGLCVTHTSTFWRANINNNKQWVSVWSGCKVWSHQVLTGLWARLSHCRVKALSLEKCSLVTVFHFHQWILITECAVLWICIAIFFFSFSPKYPSPAFVGHFSDLCGCNRVVSIQYSKYCL